MKTVGLGAREKDAGGKGDQSPAAPTETVQSGRNWRVTTQTGHQGNIWVKE